MELVVHREREQRHEGLAALDDDRHGGGGRHRRIAGDDDIHLVDVEELGIDARNGRGAALVVVVDQLHLAAQQPTLGVHVVGPNLIGDQRCLAAGGKAAAQRHAEADF
jgi:hypothetical protein